ncbi:hypothetical protein BFJ63_vAg17143 [Fusarium oxysporum f. sp. narcissi]|uniref:Uncharacterized protein n=1 Tax=Fusarium oxysporum f. sp. narcissi TaxID=451672 RepID=A0A4Q2V4Y5_FUSOX|nr:hypothetical protein BFJ63_vAg17143 [Fusarium oxysporum f. sp. narcissi]
MAGPSATDFPLLNNPWPLTTDLRSHSLAPFNFPGDLDTSWTPTFLAPQPAALDFHAATAPQPQPRLRQTQSLRPLLPKVQDASLEQAVEPKDSTNGEIAVHEPGVTVSPFTANEDRLIVSAVPRFSRPENGQVNGYVKFNWPSRSTSRRPSALIPLSSEDDVEDTTPNSVRPQTTVRSPSIILVGPVPVASPVPSGTVPPMSIEGTPASASSPIMMASSPGSPQNSSSQAVITGDPRMLPPQFGFQAKMDNIDRRLFEFCMSAFGPAGNHSLGALCLYQASADNLLTDIKNWCPGRSVLSNTNLWLKDLAPMHKNEGILHAIQSLAGVYI